MEEVIGGAGPPSRYGRRPTFLPASNDLTEYTTSAIATCKESLSQAVIVLCTLQEFVLLMERETSLVEFLKTKIRGSIIDKQPFTKVLA